jgi:hypothetical protein
MIFSSPDLKTAHTLRQEALPFRLGLSSVKTLSRPEHESGFPEKLMKLNHLSPYVSNVQLL